VESLVDDDLRAFEPAPVGDDGANGTATAESGVDDLGTDAPETDDSVTDEPSKAGASAARGDSTASGDSAVDSQLSMEEYR
jgi:hypothetical protein